MKSVLSVLFVATVSNWPASLLLMSNYMGGFSMMNRKKEKMLVPICARVSASKFRTLEVWCDNSFRKRSEVLAMVVERVLDLVEEQASSEQPVEEFVRNLRAVRGE
jgi:hypothetical protein